MAAKRPSLEQVFPDPLTQLWPSTSNPVFCECQQLYALVSLCCCVSGAHLLVLHEGPSTNMLTAMPRGPKYVDFRLSRRTSPDDVASFLIRANKAASVVSGGRWDARDGAAADLVVSESAFSPRTTPTPVSSSSVPAAAATPEVRKVVVVCLHGIGTASPEVLGLLTDAITFASVPQTRHLHRHSGPGGRRTSSPPTPVPAALSGTGMDRTMRRGQPFLSSSSNGVTAAAAAAAAAGIGAGTPSASSRRHERTVEIPYVHIVAFCDAQTYAAVLPESLRSAFDLSLSMSRVAMESAAVLQSGDSTRSNVIHKANMLELANSVDGDSLASTVTCSATVTRYLRHLLLVLRGSAFNMDSVSAYALRKLNRLVHLVRVATILFEPEENEQATELRNRWARRLRTATHSRLYSGGGSTFSPTEDGNDGPDTEDPRGERHHPLDAAHGKSPPTSYANLVVTTSAVLCLFSPLITHIITASRYTAPHRDLIEAARPLLKSVSSGPSALQMSFMPTQVNPELNVAGLWDARVVTQSGMLLRNGTAYGMVVRALGHLAFIDSTSPQQGEVDSQVLGSSRMMAPINVAGGNTLSQPTDDPALCLTKLVRSPAALALTSRLLPRGIGLGTVVVERQLNGTIAGRRDQLASSRGDAMLGEVYRDGSTGVPFDELLMSGRADSTTHSGRMDSAGLDFGSDSTYLDVLQYNEVRELIRAVIVARSAPAPG